MTEKTVKPARLAVVIGAMRCGTTTLYQLLQQTPACVSRIKEPDYFIAQKSLYRGPAWYSQLFDRPEALCVDVSPNYAKDDIFPGVAEQIFSFNPDARIIYMVRDPVERALSEYHHQRAAGVDLPQPDALLDTPQGTHILNTSRYARQLGDYLKVFPRSQVLVIDMKRLTKDPRATMNEILAFCGEETLADDLAMSRENDRSAVERLPKFWLALRRTRLGDRIRDLVPARHHKALKALGSKIVGRRPSPSGEADFSEAMLARMASLLKPDADQFRALTGMAFDHWSI